MGKFLSCGKYNENYKYILLAVIFGLISTIIFGKGYCKDSKYIYFARAYPEETEKIQIALSHHIIIHNIYRNFGILIISIILLYYEKYSLKSKRDEENAKNNNGIELIYEDTLEELEKKSLLNIIFIIILFNIRDILNLLYYQYDLNEFDIWTFELLFFAYFNYKILKIKIYSHHKFVLYLSIIACLISKMINLFAQILSDDYKFNMYNKHKFFYFIDIFSYLLIIALRTYTVTKIKEFIDVKYISSTKLLIINGIIGIFINIIIMLIFSFNKCASVDDIDIHLCNVVDIVDNNNREETYLDNFFIYFKILNHSINIGRYHEIIIEVFTSLFGTLTYTFCIYFYILIIRYLGTVHTIFYNLTYAFSVRIIYLLISATTNSNDNQVSFNIGISIANGILDLISGFGIFVYCEIIELNFCNFQYNLRKIIIKRSENDFKINRTSKLNPSLNDEDEDKETETENNDSLSINYFELKNKK